MFDDWHVVELYFETTNNHATLIGKYWITLFLVLRFLVLITFAGDAFEPEKSSQGYGVRIVFFFIKVHIS